jgi:hypothetical protein
MPLGLIARWFSPCFYVFGEKRIRRAHQLGSSSYDTITPIVFVNYLCTYDLYVPVHNAFDAGSIHYLGKWEEVAPWKSRDFGSCEMASS